MNTRKKVLKSRLKNKMFYPVRFFVHTRPGYEIDRMYFPKGMKYCNGFCQKYVERNLFNNPKKMCDICYKKEKYANELIRNKIFEFEELKDDLSLLDDYEQQVNEKLCTMCDVVKSPSNYRGRNRHCNDCELKLDRDKIHNFGKEVGEYLKNYDDMSLEDIEQSLLKLRKSFVYVITKYLKTGRQANDDKKTVIKKIMKYYEEREREKIRRDYFQQKGGRMDVETDFGKIDILTMNEMILIDLLKNWNNVIKNFIIYSTIYPNRKKTAIIIGEMNEQIEEKMKMNDIHVIFV